MLFDPHAHLTLNKREEQSQEAMYSRYPHDLVQHLAIWGNAQPFAAAIGINEIAKVIRPGRVKSYFSRLFERRNAHSALRSYYEEQLGFHIPVSDEALEEMLKEVKKFQWIEAERAGRDIWAERCPKNPEAGAAKEWFRNHFGAWYSYRAKPARG